MTGEPSNWTQTLSRAAWTLVIAAVALQIVQPVFTRALPVLLMILLLVAVYRLAIGRHHDGGW